MLCFKPKKLLVFILVIFFTSNFLQTSYNVRAEGNEGVNLLINNITLPSEVFIDEELKIPVEIINNGPNNTSAGKIHVFVNIEDRNISYNFSSSILESGEAIIINVSWNANLLGYQNLNFSIKYNDTLYDYEHKQILVKPYHVEWWNQNWHYRTFIMANGSGNTRRFFNFTKIALDLNLQSNSFFENDTIRIIQYNQNGEILEDPVVKKFNFNESECFNNNSNATGYLEWNLTGDNSVKYYYVYFDFINNTGQRRSLEETRLVNLSDDIYFFEEVTISEGWWNEIKYPVNESYFAYNTSLDFIVDTVAKAENVSVRIKINDVEKYFFDLTDKNYNISWIYENLKLNETGNWLLEVLCKDSVGFISYSNVLFYVNIVDLNISFSKDFSVDIIHVKDVLELPFIVSSVNASVFDVVLSFYVNNEFFGKKTFDIDEREPIENISLRWISDVSFEWIPYVSGVFDLEVVLDFENNSIETNESNNNISFQIDVFDWSDLKISSLTASDSTVKKYDNVTFTAIVQNIGKVSSEKYKVCFYVKKTSEQFEYNDPIYCENNNSKLKKGEKEVITYEMSFDQVGVYYFGVEVIPLKGLDSNEGNNRYVSSTFLNVYEKDSPLIKNVETKDVMIGKTSLVSAKVTDESGLKKVIINIFNPDGEKVVSNESMIYKGDNTFLYNFRNTNEIGKYSFIITAVDNSFVNNIANETGIFNVTADTVFPNIDFFDVKPGLQLLEKNVLFYCSVYDNLEIGEIKIYIVTPSGEIEKYNMSKSEDTGNYIYEMSFKSIGFYESYVVVKDTSMNTVESEKISFWITSDLDDTDNDGMPDWWENKYGLNPMDRSDAKKDKDDDGYSNLEEFKMGTNPERDFFVQNALFRVKDGFALIAVAVFMLIFLLLLSIIGFRRGIF
jgi:hypothetical protein